jgi:transposase
MEVLYPRCCGLDVHKSSIAACALLREHGRIRTERRRFTTMTQDLEALATWLRQLQVTHVAIESTGVYWKPVWNILEGHFTIILANAQHVKNVPGRKTDAKDSEWIAELVQHGLLRSSYVPPEIIRDLRDLTRGRATLSQEASRIANRIQKVLEDANIKLSSVASNTLGKSGRAMLDAIVAGQLDAEQLADLALGHLRAKIPELQRALSGKVREHHRFLLKRLLHQLRFIENEIALLDQRLEQLGEQDPILAAAVARWTTVPGMNRVSAWSLAAEIGVAMEQFPTAAHLASWAGLCPGNCESAGKHLSGKTRKGSPWLGRMACQCAWAAARTKNTYLAMQFRRLAAKRGKKRAIIGVAHSILVIAYHLQKKQCDYRDLGSDYFDRLNADGLKRYLIRRLEALGHKVTIEVAGDAA